MNFGKKHMNKVTVIVKKITNNKRMEEITTKTKLKYKSKGWQKQVNEIKIISVCKDLHSAVIYVEWKSTKYSLNLFKIDYINQIFEIVNNK